MKIFPKIHLYSLSLLALFILMFFLYKINSTSTSNISDEFYTFNNTSEQVENYKEKNFNQPPNETKSILIGTEEPTYTTSKTSNIETDTLSKDVVFSAFDFFQSYEDKKSYPAAAILNQQYDQLQKTQVSRQINSATYYVSNDGHDYNDGSFERPWKTLEYAFLQLHAGNTLLIRGGTYYPSQALYPGSKRAYTSSEESRIIIKPYNNEKVVIDGSRVYYKNSGRAWGGIINIDHCDYVTLEGLTIQNSPVMGIFVHKNNIHIKNNHIIHTGGSAIFTTRSGHIIEGNECEQNEYLGNNEVIALYNTKNSIVRYNYIHHTGNENNHKDGIAIDVKDGASNIKIYGNRIHDVGVVGIYVDARGPVDNIMIYDNYLHDSKGHGIVLSSEEEPDQRDVVLKNVVLYNNVVYNFDRGIVLGWTNTPLNPLQDIVVANNVSYKNSLDGIVLGTTPINNPALQHAKNIKIHNNIFTKNGRAQINKHSGHIHFEEYTIDKNIVFGKSDILGKNPIEESTTNLDSLLLNRTSILNQ